MNDILKVIEQRKQIYLDWLIQLCQLPSIAAQNIAMDETAQFVEELVQRVGATAHRISTNGFPVIYGVIGRGAKILSFYNHYDVQPADPLDEWDSDPFSPVIRNGALFARGVSDNKGNIIARLAAVDAYQQTRGELPFQVKFIIEGEEEIGSPHLDEFSRKHQDLIRADGCIWEAGYTDPQGHPEIYLGVKGIMSVELRARRADKDLHSMYAAIAPSSAWHLVHALQELKDEREKILIAAFYDRVREPSNDDLEMIRRMPFDEPARRRQLGIAEFNRKLSGESLLRQHIFQPTCNICGIWGGYTGRGQKTIIPGQTSAKLDFRLVPDQDPSEIYALLVQHLQRMGYGDIEVELLAAGYPARTPIDHPFARLVMDTAAQVYRKSPIVYPMVPGSGPMHVLCQRNNIPAVSIGVGNANSRNHGPNENILLRDFYHGILHLAAILERFPQRW